MVDTLGVVHWGGNKIGSGESALEGGVIVGKSGRRTA